MKDGLLLAGAILAALIISLLGYGCVQANTPEGKQRAVERDAIAECRKGESDELQELSTRRFVRQVCDKMTADFRANWGREP